MKAANLDFRAVGEVSTLGKCDGRFRSADGRSPLSSSSPSESVSSELEPEELVSPSSDNASSGLSDELDSSDE